MHVFAHNGNLEIAPLRDRFPLGVARPLGETDSEHAFCALLARLAELWLARTGPPPLADRVAVVAAFAAELRSLGPANFLYCDGDALFAHGHARMHGAEGIRPPGLHSLCRRCVEPSEATSAAGLSIELSAGEQHVVLFASVPLTAEPGWQPLAAGELVVARAGLVVDRIAA
jgi:predicted glutamine amidotransferase